MHTPSRFHLFQGYGVELEYMVVDRDTLAVKPVVDELLFHELGHYGSDVDKGIVTWSNELVLHVIELKSTNPESNFNVLENAFTENIQRINALLSTWNAMLLPSAAHPSMDPLQETKIWPHDNNEVYGLYNQLFDCQGHGWSNLQSTHLNLPFYDDEEFARLHAAVRFILPILPALCASSPILDGKVTGLHDTRLKFYKENQKKFPSITGKVIPEAVFSKRNYLQTIYDKIKSDLEPHNSEGILDPVWVNSRGAIARFDRGSIEIRIMDCQECPSADLAIVSLVTETLKSLAFEKFCSLERLMHCKTDSLSNIFNQVLVSAENTVIDCREYLDMWGWTGKNAKASELWPFILNQVKKENPLLENWSKELNILFQEGTLSTRILKSIGNNPSPGAIHEVYRKLSDCLAQNKPFVP